MRTRGVVGVLVGLAAMAVFGAEACAMYNPATGTFMQRDPGPDDPARAGTSGPVAGEGFLQRDPVQQYADGMNLYQYLDSTPVMSTDPSGLWRYVGGMGMLSGTFGAGPEGPLSSAMVLGFEPFTEKFKANANGTCCAEIRFVQIVKQFTKPYGWIYTHDWQYDSEWSTPWYPHGDWKDPSIAGSSMHDTPGFAWWAGKRFLEVFSQEFETCAVCSKSKVPESGRGCGDVFGCVKWTHFFMLTGNTVTYWDRAVDKVGWSNQKVQVIDRMTPVGIVKETIGGPGYDNGHAFWTPGNPPGETMKGFLPQ